LWFAKKPCLGRPTLVVAQADLVRLPTLAAGALKLLEDLGHGRPVTLFAIVESLSCPKSVQSHWSWARGIAVDVVVHSQICAGTLP